MQPQGPAQAERSRPTGWVPQPFVLQVCNKHFLKCYILGHPPPSWTFTIHMSILKTMRNPAELFSFISLKPKLFGFRTLFA